MQRPVVISIIAGLSAGLVGGMIGGWLFSGGSSPSDALSAETAVFQELTVDKLTVNEGLAVLSKDEGVVCRMMDGSMLASREIVAGEMRTNWIAAKNFCAAEVPTGERDQQRIVSELAATPHGGVLFLRNIAAANTDDNKGGYVLCMGYNDVGEPLIYGIDQTKSPAEVNIEFAPKTALATKPNMPPAPERDSNPIRR